MVLCCTCTCVALTDNRSTVMAHDSVHADITSLIEWGLLRNTISHPHINLMFYNHSFDLSIVTTQV